MALSPTMRRRGTTVIAALALMTIFGMGTATQAMAYTCSWNSVYLDDGSASATVNVGRYCSDGRAHLYGTIWDDLCDGRRAELMLRFHNGDRPAYRFQYPQAGNGCGTSASYSYSSTNDHVDIYACIRALNGGPTQSRGDCSWV
jgi:hypothetical protein